VESIEKPLKFTEFVELMLARIAEEDRQQPGAFIDMFPLAEGLRQEIPKEWVFDARDGLEARGLVHPLKVLGYTAPARLTGEGRLYVEQGGETGVIDDYWSHPMNFVFVTGEGHQVAVGVQGDVTQSRIESVPEEAWALLDQIESTLADDATLEPDEREEALVDVRTARDQLRRKRPNKAAVIGLLTPLAQIASVGAFVTKLVVLFT
jgi:hypothetical protein